MIVDKINQYLSSKEPSPQGSDRLQYEVEKLAGLTFKQKFLEKDEYDGKLKLWVSSTGKCSRANAYQYHGFKKNGKEFDSRAKLVFWAGDITELTVIALAKSAGCPIIGTGFDQLRIKWQVGEYTITGKADGVYIGDKIALVEVKSMTSFRFKDFEKGVIDDSYLAQMNAQMEALGIDRTIMVAQNKDAGLLSERIIQKDPEIVARIRKNALAVFESTPEKLPERPYKADAKGFLPWQCRYCSYFKECWPNAVEVVVSGKYKLKLKEEVHAN